MVKRRIEIKLFINLLNYNFIIYFLQLFLFTKIKNLQYILLKLKNLQYN